VEEDYARREFLLGVEALPFGREEKGQPMWAADMRGGDEEAKPRTKDTPQTRGRRGTCKRKEAICV